MNTHPTPIAALRRSGAAALTSVLLLGPALSARADRYSEFNRKAASHDRYLDPVAATFFGSEGIEEFVAVDTLRDGSILAFGNAWGPQFPAQPRPRVLGRGQHRGLDPFDGRDPRTGGHPSDLARHNPDVAGMFVRFSPDMQRVVEVTRFDWGVASLEFGRVNDQGKLVVTGHATRAFREWAGRGPRVREAPAATGRNTGSRRFQGVETPGDVFIAQIDPATWNLEWAWLFPGYRNAPDPLHLDHEGNYVFSAGGWWRLRADGSELTPIERTAGSGRLLGVSRKDGSLIGGGHNNPGTGREPWWRPYVHGFDADGTFRWEIYGWDGGVVGHDNFRLVSDSYVRDGGFDVQGNILIIGSSDGGNSVYTRHPFDLRRPHGGSGGYGMSTWGMQVGQATYIVRINPENFDVLVMSSWLSYVPGNFESASARNRPNTINISQFRSLDEGGFIFTGRSATGLIETPNAIWTYPRDGSRFGGQYVAAFNRDFTQLRYSSYLPGVRLEGLEKTRDGFAAVGSALAGHNEDLPTPLLRPLQPRFGGGYADAYIVVFRGPLD